MFLYKTRFHLSQRHKHHPDSSNFLSLKKLSSSQVLKGLREVVEAEFYEDIADRCTQYHEYLKNESMSS
jgi:hypothetical protein